MKFELTQTATEDLRSIGQYTLETWGEDQQDRYLKGIYVKFGEIQEAPARWRFRNDLFPLCQIARYGRHVILFRCENDRLIVVRVLHGSMDFQQHIPDGF